MSVEINDLGNGSGYLYITDQSDNILTAEINTPQGYRNIRASGLTAAPIAARKSSTGSITVTSASGAGSITAITVNGVNQISASIPIASSTPSVVAETIATAINSYTPISGYNYTASLDGDVVYIIAPSIVGSNPNGYVVAVTKTGTSTFTVTNMADGSSNNGIIDYILGLKFYLNSDPAATPTSLVGAIDVTKYLVTRGLQTGIIVKDLSILNDGIYNVDRASAITLVNCTPETGSSDTLAFIDPVGFVEGDILMVRSSDPSFLITIESAPISTSAAPIKNIYLSGNLAFEADQFQTLLLQYRYIDGIGACFVESSRTLSIGNSFNIYNTDGFLSSNRVLDGDGNTLTFQNLSQFSLGSTGTITIANTTSPTTIMTMANNLVQFNTPGGTWFSYGDLFTVTAFSGFDIQSGTAGLIGTSSGGNVSRIGFGSGEIRIDATGQLTVYSGGVFKYKLPITAPTNGQVLTCIDGAGTTAWV